jgi:predicted nuclease of restriction endonuclease-like (RecB) superfamily
LLPYYYRIIVVAKTKPQWGKNMSAQPGPLADNYTEFLNSLKERIKHAQLRAGLAVNRELVLLYWQMGRDILARQQQQGWGTKVIDRLALDLRRAFPGMKGFSRRNLQYIRAFAEAWTDEPIVQEVLAQITWYHNVTLLEKLNSPELRLWYAHQSVQNGWSRNMLVHHLERELHLRQGQSSTNFSKTLPPAQSDLAHQLLKDPYSFDFLGLDEEAQERDLERALVRHIREFLLELGSGFAFVGSQYRLVVDGQEFFIDLLFYHLKLRCYVVIDLKISDFQPEYAGKMNFYLSAVDDMLRHSDDQPSVGIILCKSRHKTVAEYALRDFQKPIGISVYELTRVLPEKLQGSLPTIEELELELEGLAEQ